MRKMEPEDIGLLIIIGGISLTFVLIAAASLVAAANGSLQ